MKSSVPGVGCEGIEIAVQVLLQQYWLAPSQQAVPCPLQHVQQTVPQQISPDAALQGGKQIAFADSVSINTLLSANTDTRIRLIWFMVSLPKKFAGL